MNLKGLLALKEIERQNYDKYIVAFSGGKDSIACLLHLLELGVPKERIELWHHLIDGEPGSEPFMDWPMTEDYCRNLAEAFDIPIYFSWRHGGFKRELLKENDKVAPVSWENPDGTIGTAGGKRGKIATRRKFPQVSPDLRVRWCSSVLKIDVMSIAINNQERFKGSKTLVITGERAEESSSRAKYEVFTDHRCNSSKRTVHHWRPIHNWTREEVWDIIKRYGVKPHPAYRLGWGRLSCMTCIFGNADQWKRAHGFAPEMVEEIMRLEEEFGTTIKRDKSIKELIKTSKIRRTNMTLKERDFSFNGVAYKGTMIVPEYDRDWYYEKYYKNTEDTGPT